MHGSAQAINDGDDNYEALDPTRNEGVSFQEMYEEFSEQGEA